ncbi:class I SAM-dependent methyltransferase [Streptomyces sp. NBC_01619]|uniref:class I SAM-dependent methyltransferase n=1 Tax=Streptomyces sp. NBC_01619 TaxID=2975901 RepID=UPI002258973F|nr:class I SAM-dependent methyltransferase [Streptomyces sp. NBC_01619]MCX4515786.1 class I SAM-dependent methyltransferase [Streptomyces sp. NBC_01619]
MSENPVAQFYDDLATDFHVLYEDWDGALARQGETLGEMIHSTLGVAPVNILDCACGIGTQAIGLALQGHHVTGTDLSPVAAVRAAREATRRGLNVATQTADMRALPFIDDAFDVVVCADNSLPHLLTDGDIAKALAEMCRVMRSRGLLLISTRPYDEILQARPTATPLRLHNSGISRTISFQLWDWHADGEHYDLEHFQLDSRGGNWFVKVRRATYWALTRERLATFAQRAGFVELAWIMPEEGGFFQPLLHARRK